MSIYENEKIRLIIITIIRLFSDCSEANQDNLTKLWVT